MAIGPSLVCRRSGVSFRLEIELEQLDDVLCADHEPAWNRERLHYRGMILEADLPSHHLFPIYFNYFCYFRYF
jgi:hypothetical protein